MGIPELEQKRVALRLNQFCERIPMNMRDQLSFHWKVRGNQVTLFERRPTWQGQPGEFTDPYESLDSVRSFDRLMEEIESDPTEIFLGQPES